MVGSRRSAVQRDGRANQRTRLRRPQCSARRNQSVRDDLRPDRDHAQKQSQRRQGGSFLDHCAEHKMSSSRTRREHSSRYVRGQSHRRWQKSCSLFLWLSDSWRSAVVRPTAGRSVRQLAVTLIQLDDQPVAQRHAAVHARRRCPCCGWRRSRRGPRRARAGSASRTHARRCADRDCRSARRPAGPAAHWRPRAQSRPAAARRPTVRPAGGQALLQAEIAQQFARRAWPLPCASGRGSSAAASTFSSAENSGSR